MIESKYFLIISYEGTDFYGSQIQKNLRTVQGDLEYAIEKIFRTHSRVLLASRTDTGVHADFQVGTFVINGNNKFNSNSLRSALNTYLSGDLKILYAGKLSEGYIFFNPRRDAISREYIYTFDDAEVLEPKFRNYVHHVNGKLDENKMDEAASFLIGTHDFVSFSGSSTSLSDSTIRNVFDCKVTRIKNKVFFSIIANAFLHQQIRRISALLLEIGLNKKSPNMMKKILASKNKEEFTHVLSPNGLCLKKIEYKEKFLQKIITHSVNR